MGLFFNPQLHFLFKNVFISSCISNICCRRVCSAAGLKVLLVDQWIETGGTMKAAIQLVEKLGATVVGQYSG